MGPRNFSELMIDTNMPTLLGSCHILIKSNCNWISLMKTRCRLFPVFALFALLGTLMGRADPAMAGRVALVVGNAAYENTEPLANPRNDAEAMARTLRELGFEVFDGYDLTRSGFEDLIRDFARGAREADAAVLYYAGHGLEVASVNYLVPVDATIRDETDLKFETIILSDIIALMEREQRTNLVFLDACRDNPMARNLSLNMGTRSVAVGRGLAPIDTGVGTMIAYSTQPGNVALDGIGQHSPFTDALLEHISTPALDVEIMMRRVRRDVMQETAGQQVPWSSSSLTGSFVFQPQVQQTPVPAAVPPVVTKPDVAAAEPDTGDEPETVGGKEAIAVPEAVERDREVVAILPEPSGEPKTDVPDDNVLLSSVDHAVAGIDQAPTDTAVPTRVAPLSEKELARRTQAALNRLGCDAGTEDGIWGKKSRSALERLGIHAPTLKVAALDPTETILRQMEALDGRICPLECAVTEDLVDGSCVGKTCPTGQRLSSKGQCYTPQAASSRQRSSTRSRSSSNCFSFNGQTFCE